MTYVCIVEIRIADFLLLTWYVKRRKREKCCIITSFNLSFQNKFINLLGESVILYFFIFVNGDQFYHLIKLNWSPAVPTGAEGEIFCFLSPQAHHNILAKIIIFRRFYSAPSLRTYMSPCLQFSDTPNTKTFFSDLLVSWSNILLLIFEQLLSRNYCPSIEIITVRWKCAHIFVIIVENDHLIHYF